MLLQGRPKLVIAYPIYDAVFKALMDDAETARGFVSALIGRRVVVHLQLLAQEQPRRDAGSGEVKVFRLDFCATSETESAHRFQVLIELLTLDALFVRIPKIEGATGSELERVSGDPQRVGPRSFSAFGGRAPLTNPAPDQRPN